MEDMLCHLIIMFLVLNELNMLSGNLTPVDTDNWTSAKCLKYNFRSCTSLIKSLLLIVYLYSIGCTEMVKGVYELPGLMPVNKITDRLSPWRDRLDRIAPLEVEDVSKESFPQAR